MTPDDLENLRKFSICADQFGDGMTIVPQALLAKALAEIEAARAMRLKLDRRIHNQRKANRDTWEIVEMRQNYMGGQASRATLGRHIKWLKEARTTIETLRGYSSLTVEKP